MRIWILSTVLLTACMTSTGFKQNYSEAYCEKWDECLGLEAWGSSVEECVEDAYDSWEEGSCDDFNAESASECLEGIDDASCPSFLGAAASVNCQAACE